MASKVRFIDNLRVGAYAIDGADASLLVDNNVNNYLLTATGNEKIKGNEGLQFDGVNFGIGGPSNGARFEINDTTGNDLLIIKNNNNQGIKINDNGVFQLLEFSSLPTAVEGGIAYSSDDFWVGTSI